MVHFKTFVNNKSIPCIPSVFHENKFITTFKEKVELFNIFFAHQCTLLNNSTALPNNLAKRSNKSLDTVNFSTDDVSKINNLDPNKAHGHDMLSTRMIKLCGNSKCKPLLLIFNDFITEEKFPSDWKKAHVVSVHKEGDKKCLKNYNPISIIPICSKIFERLIYNELFTFFIDNNFISANHLGFRPGDFCINQLMAITHEIYKSLNDRLEVWGVFLDISKAFDKVWLEGLLLKLSLSCIAGNILKLLRDFLFSRKQRVALIGQNSHLKSSNAGVPQGSLLGPLLFLIYINDFSNGVF